MTDDPVTRARRALEAATVWDERGRLATLHWWSDPRLLPVLGAGLAGLFPDCRPTLVAGVQSSGYLLAPLTAVECGTGMLGVQKLTDVDGTITLATARDSLSAHDRVLLVDDVWETGAQATTVRGLVESRGARWLGTAVLVSYAEAEGLRALWSIDDLYRRTAERPI